MINSISAPCGRKTFQKKIECSYKNLEKFQKIQIQEGAIDQTPIKEPNEKAYGRGRGKS